MELIIVESPTKAKTIQKFLGKDYSVVSSYGHVRDLPQNDFGVDAENNFQPKYVVPVKAKKRIADLKSVLAKSDSAILATDEDREGEAIAFHLKEVLKIPAPKRIVFHEITKSAIANGLKNPREIDMNLVNAQQTRRILDRIVGYKLSPLLWKKVSRGLSAGRVQSVAVRLIVEREREIEKFKPEEFWQIAALFKKEAQFSEASPPKIEFEAILIKKNNKTIPKLGIKNKDEAEKILKDLEDAEYKVESIEKKETKRNPLPPFTTSSLQQEAWQRLHWPAKMTMSVAQALYEKGFISYHRTDSLNLSETSQGAAKKFIEETCGKDYWPGFFRNYKTRAKSAQEAHEAIRPAYPGKNPETLKTKMDDRLFRLYDLIWRRFMASQMTEAKFASSQIDIAAKNYTFRANGQTLKFDGFLKIYPLKFSETELPELRKNEALELKKLIPSQHFTQPPSRYTEATLIKTLEAEGIGRPSTYAPILETIQRRNYAQKNEEKRFAPTEIGTVVNDLLVAHFPSVVDIKFTANMEENLDNIAQGKKNWVKTLRDFYQPFKENLEAKYQEITKEKIVEQTDKSCPKCGAKLLLRLGRFGKFYACSAFPKCRHTEGLEKKTLDIPCPKCGKGEITEKRSKAGKLFFGCSLWPKCDCAFWDKPINEKCPRCGALFVETKRKQIVCSNKDCKHKKE